MSYLLSIDPAASKAHWCASWANGELLDIQATVAFGVDGCLGFTHGGRIVIEDQWVSPLTAQSTVKLAKAAGHLVGAMGLDLADVSWVMPRDWKKRLCRCDAPKIKKGGIKMFPKYEVHKANLEILSEEEVVVYSAALKGKGLQRAMDIADCVGIGLDALGRVRGS